jgi:PAS domain S-box-containing protein
MPSVPASGTTSASGGPIAVGNVLLDASSIQQVFEMHPDAIAIHQDGKLLYVNQAGVRLVGASDSSELLGRPVMDFVHPDSRQFVAERMRSVVKGSPGAPALERFIRVDGTPVEVEVLALPVSIDGRPASQLVIRDMSQQVAAERQRDRLLAESEATVVRMNRYDRALRLAEEAAGLGVWDWDVASNTLNWTPGLEPLHGLEPGTFGGTFADFLAAIIDDDRPTVAAAIQRAVTTGPDEFEVEFRVRDPGGALRWVMGKGRVFRNADGMAERMTGIGLDVSERRELREELSRTLDWLRLVLDSLPSPVAYLDADRRYRMTSRAHERWMGRPVGELEGQLKKDVLGAREFARIEPYIDRVLEGEPVSFETDLLFPAMGWRFIRMSYVPHFGTDGTVDGFISMTTDLTDRRRAERRSELLAEAGARLATELDARATATALARLIVPSFADQCVIDVFEHGRLRRLAGVLNAPGGNDVVMRPRRAPEYAPTDPRLETLREGKAQLFAHFDDETRKLFARDDDDLQAFRRLKATSMMVAPIAFGNEVLGILTIAASDNSRVYDEDDLLTAIELGRRAGVAITNALLYEQSQQVSEALAAANRAKDEFLGLVSHELRNPLTTIAGNAIALLRDNRKPFTEADRAALVDMKAGAERLKALVENMLVLSRLGDQHSIEPEPVLVSRLMERVVARFRAEHPNREFVIQTKGNLPLVLAEPTSVEQIIDNLLSNAAKYSTAEAPVELEAHTEGEHLAISVSDRGIGFDEPEAIFEPFHRAPESAATAPGLGLGLTVCKRLVEILGGSIGAKAREGGGSTFTFTLPLMRDEGFPQSE